MIQENQPQYDNSPLTDHDEKLLIRHNYALFKYYLEESVIGQEQAVQTISQICLNMSMPQEVKKHFGVTAPKLILFHGLPGTGKTLLATQMAIAIEATLLVYNPARVQDPQWIGNTEKAISSTFARAREIAEQGNKAIIFIDEAQTVAGGISTSGGLHGGKQHPHVFNTETLLQEIEGADKLPEGVLIILATNNKRLLDPGILNRCREEIYFGLPDQAAREELVEKILDDADSLDESDSKFNEIAFNDLIARMDGLAQRDIVTVIQKALNIRQKTLLEEQNLKPLEISDLEEALDQYLEQKSKKSMDERDQETGLIL